MTLLDRGTGGSPILDYAGPASRRTLRLPARSVLTVRNEGGKLVILERLAGQGEAIGALVFAAFTVFVVASLELSLAEKWHRNLDWMLLLAALMAGELIVGAM